MEEVSNYIVKPISVDKDRSLVLALDLMEDYNLSCLIVAEDDRIIGLITIREILRRIWSERIRLTSFFPQYVTSVMIDNPIVVSGELSISRIASILVNRDLTVLPVIDNDDLIGLVTEESLSKSCLKIDLPVNSILNYEYPKVRPEDKILYARSLMIDRKISVLPVIRNEKVLGLFSNFDIVRLMGRFYEHVPERHGRMRIEYLLVSDAMRRIPPKVTVDEPISEAARIMLNEGLRGIVVTGIHGEFVGVLQIKDLFRTLVLNKG